MLLFLCEDVEEVGLITKVVHSSTHWYGAHTGAITKYYFRYYKIEDTIWIKTILQKVSNALQQEPQF